MQCSEKNKQEKTPETIKKEFLASKLEVSNEEEGYLQRNEELKDAKELKNGTSLEKYEDLLKGANRKIINIVGKQGELLKDSRTVKNCFTVWV